MFLFDANKENNLALLVLFRNWNGPARWMSVVVLSSLLAFTSSGCFKPSNDRKNVEQLFGEQDSAATFFVLEVKGEAQNPKDTATTWRVPLAKTFVFKACLGERQGLRNLQGHKFRVESVESGRSTDVKLTGNDGCLRWEETFPYNYFAYRPYYIELHRRVIGAGVHTGVANVRLAINPWAEERGGRDAVVFLLSRDADGRLNTNDQINPTLLVDSSKATAALEGRLSKERPKLWMSSVSPLLTIDKVNEKKDLEGVQVAILNQMRAEVLVEDLKGARKPLPLTNGVFEVSTHLIAAQLGSRRDQHMLLTPGMKPAKGIIVSDRLETSTSLLMLARANRANLEMMLRVRPVGAPGEMEPFEGVFVLGELDRVIGSQSPRLKPEMYGSEDKPFDVAAYVESAMNFETLKKSHSVFKLKPYVLDIAKVLFTGVEPGETSTRRTVGYQVEVCVNDFLTGRKVQFQPFDIMVVDIDPKTKQQVTRPYTDRSGKPQQIATNQMGCLIWTDAVSHRYYVPEDYVFRDFVIKSPSGDFEETKRLVINPWDAMFRTFGWDRQQFTEEFIAGIESRKKEPSRVFIPSFSYHTLRFKYEIDRFMNLEVKKSILLNLHPKVLRYNAIIDGRKRTEDLRDGIYRLKVAIQKDYLDPANKGLILYPDLDDSGKVRTTKMRSNGTAALQGRHFVSVVDKLVRVNGGQIATPAEFSMHDLRLMRTRAQLMVQIETIDEKALQMANVLDAGFHEWLKRTKGWLDSDVQKARQLNPDGYFQHKLEYRKLIEKLLADIREKDRLYERIFRFQDAKIPEALQHQIAEMEKKIDEAVRLADFTVAPAAPVVELDALVEKDSGLQRRTFLGPIIFLSNAYSDDLRPTDNLDEVFCREADCNALTAFERPRSFRSDFYEDSPYFGSVKHLAKFQVDDLIKVYVQQKKMYERTMPVMASVSNFLKFYNLAFVSLRNEKLQRLKPGCVNTDGDLKVTSDFEKCLEETAEGTFEWAHFLKMLNENPTYDHLREGVGYNFMAAADWKRLGFLDQVDRSDLEQVAISGKLSSRFAARLCGLLASSIPGSVPGMTVLSRPRSDAFRACILRAAADLKKAYVLDRKLRVFETGGYIFKGGKQLNFNVGANYNLSHAEKFGFGASFGYGDVAKSLVGAIPSVGSELLKMVSPIGIKNSYDLDRVRSEGTSISEATYLVGQFADFNLELKKFERCVVLKLHPSILDGVGGKIRSNVLLSEQEKANLNWNLNRGLYLCSGVVEDQPIEVNEHYFYFTQHFTEGDMLDQADLYNHPWLLGLRGMRDFSRFVYLLRAQEFELTAVTKKAVEKPGWPLEQMVKAYEGFLPSFYGLFTLLEGDEILPEYPLPKGTSIKFFNDLSPVLRER